MRRVLLEFLKFYGLALAVIALMAEVYLLYSSATEGVSQLLLLKICQQIFLAALVALPFSLLVVLVARIRGE